jgi:hypothetical protein
MSYERYAIYWAPPRGSDLERLGRVWFGVDAEAGAYIMPREFFGLPHTLVMRAVASPRRYCLHATLKAPFRLAPERTEAELRAAMAAFCVRRRRFAAGPLKLHTFGEYLTLLPEPPLADLDWLAAECVVAFDAFRAPLNDADRARRPQNLPAAQAALMEQFGYPYIFGDFRFHVTLAGPLPAAELAQLYPSLSDATLEGAWTPLAFKELCLFGDPGGDGPFRLIERFPLLR